MADRTDLTRWVAALWARKHVSMNGFDPCSVCSSHRVRARRINTAEALVAPNNRKFEVEPLHTRERRLGRLHGQGLDVSSRVIRRIDRCGPLNLAVLPYSGARSSDVWVRAAVENYWYVGIAIGCTDWSDTSVVCPRWYEVTLSGKPPIDHTVHYHWHKSRGVPHDSR